LYGSCLIWMVASIGRGTIMAAGWAGAVKFRAYNLKVRVNKATFASPGL
jgi:hypothetical protein